MIIKIIARKKIVKMMQIIAHLLCVFPFSDILIIPCSHLFQRGMASASSGNHTLAMGLLYCITNPSGSRYPIVPATTSSSTSSSTYPLSPTQSVQQEAISKKIISEEKELYFVGMRVGLGQRVFLYTNKGGLLFLLQDH